jgi:hypothetical protein
LFVLIENSQRRAFKSPAGVKEAWKMSHPASSVCVIHSFVSFKRRDSFSATSKNLIVDCFYEGYNIAHFAALKKRLELIINWNNVESQVAIPAAAGLLPAIVLRAARQVVNV